MIELIDYCARKIAYLVRVGPESRTELETLHRRLFEIRKKQRSLKEETESKDEDLAKIDHGIRMDVVDTGKDKVVEKKTKNEGSMDIETDDDDHQGKDTEHSSSSSSSAAGAAAAAAAAASLADMALDAALEEEAQEILDKIKVLDLNASGDGGKAKGAASGLEVARGPEREVAQHQRTLGFRCAISAVVVSRYLSEHLDSLPLSALSRVLDTHDFVVLAVPLIENPPWTRRDKVHGSF